MNVEELLAALTAIIDEAKGRELTDEEVERYEKLEGQLEKRKQTDEIQKRNAAYNTPATSPVFADTSSKNDDTLERAFSSYLRTGKENADIVELRAQSVGTDSAGGFLVPEGFRQKLVDRLKAFGGLANEVETVTTESGNRLPWPTLDDTANTGEIAAEGAGGAGGADLVFGEKELNAFKYVAPGAGALPLRVSVEFLQDSAFDAEALVSSKLGQRIARQQANHWASGVGTTEPEGIATGATQTQAFTVPTAAATTTDELIDAMLTVDPDYREGGIWVISDHAWGVLRKLKDADNRPLLMPSAEASIGDKPGGFIEGHRVVIDTAFDDFANPGLGNTNTWGVFGQMAESYVIRRVKDIQLIVNPYSRANEGQVEYTLWARADGAVQNEFSYAALQVVGS